MSYTQKSSSPITLAIIHWNNVDNLGHLLRGLGDDIDDFEVIVVNNSPEVSLSTLQKNFRSVKWITNSYNRGFSFACNQATSIASGDWVFFLNPDVLVTSKQINDLLSYAKQKKFVAVSPKPTSKNYWKPLPSLFSILSEFTPLKKVIPQWFFFEKTLTGGSLLIKTEVLKNLGGWDERFFLWFEDSDLTQRLHAERLNYGWASIAFSHAGGQSVQLLPQKQQLHIFFHSLRVYAKKHFSWLSQKIISAISQHYNHHHLLPQINKEITSITVPNLSPELLFNFLQKNYSSCAQKNSELTLVTTKLPSVQFWRIKQKYPEARIINLETNNGFAETTNIGFQVSTGSTVGTINDDVMIEKNALQKLLSQKNNGSLNPKIVNQNNVTESIGVKILRQGKAQPNLSTVQKETFEVDATNAAAVFYQATALENVGLYDERFGSYLEDIDLSLRLKKSGYKNDADPSVVVHHLKHQTSQRFSVLKAWNDMKNWWLLILKHPAFFQVQNNILFILLERGRNFLGVIKAIISRPKSLLWPLIILGIICLYLSLRFYNIENSLLFFNDIGRDFLTLLRWEQTGKPPLLGPQTSALPYNQSALYFYVLYPLFILTHHSPFSTLYTNAIFYVTFFLFGIFLTRKQKLLRHALLFTSLIIAVHPQFIYQQRFVWNPSFVAPFIVAGTFFLVSLSNRFSYSKLFLLSLSFSFSSAFSYSALPTLIASFIMLILLVPRKFLYVVFSFCASLFIVNLPTLFFEFRHHFLLTKLLLYGEKLPQFETSLHAKIVDTLRFSILQSSEVNILVIVLFTSIILFAMIQKRKDAFSSPIFLISILFILNFAILAVAPVSIQAHYVFPFLTILIMLVSFFPSNIRLIFTIIILLFFLQPNYLNQYFSRAYRTVAETNSCAEKICSQETKPLFISVQSDLHPYHNGMEFKYVFAENGCNIKELDTQITEATIMAVVVDHSEYEHGKTSYNELTQFGASNQIRSYICQDDLRVIILERK